MGLIEDTDSVVVADNGSIWLRQFQLPPDTKPCAFALIRKGSKIRLDLVDQWKGPYDYSHLRLQPRSPLRPGAVYHLQSKCSRLEKSYLSNESGDRVRFHGMAGVDLVKPVWHGPPKIRWQARHCPICGNDPLDLYVDLQLPVSDGSQVHFEVMLWHNISEAPARAIVETQPLEHEGNHRLYFEYGETLEGTRNFLLVCAVDAAGNRSCAVPLPFVPIARDWKIQCTGEMGEYVTDEQRQAWRQEGGLGLESTAGTAADSLSGYEARLQKPWRSLPLWGTLGFVLLALHTRRRRQRKRNHRNLGELGVADHDAG